MKTRDKILLTSLHLFNTEGEQNVTTVDISNEMDISPGNLYYHFRGKESIIDELYRRFDSELSSLLHQSIEDLDSLEQHWLFLYVIFEEIYQFRFFYLNASEMLLRYPDIERRFRRLIQLKIRTIEAFFARLIDIESIEQQQLDIGLLAENITLNFLYWFPYQQLLNPNMGESERMHKAVYNILNLIVPYSGSQQQDFIAALKVLYQTHIL